MTWSNLAAYKDYVIVIGKLLVSQLKQFNDKLRKLTNDNEDAYTLSEDCQSITIHYVSDVFKGFCLVKLDNSLTIDMHLAAFVTKGSSQN